MGRHGCGWGACGLTSLMPNSCGIGCFSVAPEPAGKSETTSPASAVESIGRPKRPQVRIGPWQTPAEERPWR